MLWITSLIFLSHFCFQCLKNLRKKNRIIEYENKNKFSSIFIKKKKKLKIVGKDYEHIGEKSCFLFSYARIKCQLG